MNQLYRILDDLRPEFDFNESQNYIEDGFLDSFDIITLVDELEDVYEIKIDGLEIIPENFENAKKIAELIIRNGGQVH